ncbi:MAG: hypothetical protein AVDCRST_MAG03-10, partial [uncultured Rubrobacteraceae bacterium]
GPRGYERARGGTAPGGGGARVRQVPRAPDAGAPREGGIGRNGVRPR